MLQRKELTTKVRGILFAVLTPVAVTVLMLIVVLGASIGAIIGAVALPLKILDGRVIDAPAGIKNVFSADRDEI